MLSFDDVQRLNLGYVLKPAELTDDGHPQVVPVLAYHIAHPDGGILVDAGVAPLGSELEARFRPHRIPLPEALDAAGRALSDVRVVVPCHLHFDHVGDMSQLVGRPVVVQRIEHEAAKEPGYTVDGLAEDETIAWELIDGEEELMEGVRILPTPGHTAGHQSLVIRAEEGSLVLAGQALDTASEWSAAYLNYVVSSQGEDGDGLELPYPSWMPKLQEFRPSVVLFAHDLPMWTTAS
ncbi:MAG: MBL fold metallo-hydrolase [Chloroflexota bacterium]|nr:MBL fold metallo-hydrolase [Chloroflexota bacterium]